MRAEQLVTPENKEVQGVGVSERGRGQRRWVEAGAGASVATAGAIRRKDVLYTIIK